MKQQERRAMEWKRKKKGKQNKEKENGKIIK